MLFGLLTFDDAIRFVSAARQQRESAAQIITVRMRHYTFCALLLFHSFLLFSRIDFSSSFTALHTSAVCVAIYRFHLFCGVFLPSRAFLSFPPVDPRPWMRRALPDPFWPSRLELRQFTSDNRPSSSHSRTVRRLLRRSFSSSSSRIAGVQRRNSTGRPANRAAKCRSRLTPCFTSPATVTRSVAHLALFRAL